MRKSPFPGMDPYLEQHWRDVHASLVIYLRDQIQPQLPDDLRARVEERVFVEAPRDRQRAVYPDVRVFERRPSRLREPSEEYGIAVADPLVMHVEDEERVETFIEIIDMAGGDVVTVVEVLSITNKLPGPGQEKYLRKREEVLSGKANLVEIDLLRAGDWIALIRASELPETHRTPYRVTVSRGDRPLEVEYYRVPLRERLPRFRLPLRATDADALLDLQQAIDLSYRNGAYDDLDYTRSPDPPLDSDDAAWAADRIGGGRAERE